MKVSLVPGTTAYCKSIWSSFDPAKLICTNGAAGKDTCSGDSGGPLATPINNAGSLAVAGITSFAPVTSDNPDGLCAVAGSTGYYVHVGYYIDWIAHAAKLDAGKIGVSSMSGSDSSSSSDANSDDNGLDSIINLETESGGSDIESESGSAGAASALVADKKTLSSVALGLAAIGLAVLF
ncbi:hypothetical protein GGI22_003680 [Coemansia erecta]|nr:hypothetical protein GGI22_003680 [Coemansia erecta]